MAEVTWQLPAWAEWLVWTLIVVGLTAVFSIVIPILWVTWRDMRRERWGEQ